MVSANDWIIGDPSEAELWQPIIDDIPGYSPIATRLDEKFDPIKAADAIAFVEHYCRHSEGDLAGELIKLERWQRAIFANLFGWYRPNGNRRYRQLLLYIPRKNGKSMLAAALILYVAYCDTDGRNRRSRLQINGAAGSFKQASVVFTYAAAMIEEDPALKALAKVHDSQSLRTIIRYATTDRIGHPLAVYSVLSGRLKAKHGLNTHLGIYDELHEADDNGKMFDTIETSMGSRAQPIMAILTTADYQRPESVCNEKYDYFCSVRDGIRTDERARESLPIIYEASETDDWTDPAVWHRANPNLGVSFPVDYLRSQCQDAQANPRKVNTFKRLHLNIRTSTLQQWIPLPAWDACTSEFAHEDMAGMRCYAGLDLASARDLAALILIFPKYTPDELDNGEAQLYRIIPFFWMPRDNLAERSHATGMPYMEWSAAGLVKLTDGTRIDYRTILADIRTINETYPLAELRYDPWNAEHLAQELLEPLGIEKPITAVRYHQTAAAMNTPCRELEAVVYDKRLEHDGNAVMRYMIPKTQIRETPDGLIKPDRKRSTSKIDGVVALVTGLAGAMGPMTREDSSVYETRGFIRL